MKYVRYWKWRKENMDMNEVRVVSVTNGFVLLHTPLYDTQSNPKSQPPKRPEAYIRQN